MDWISVTDEIPEEGVDVLVRISIGDASWYEVGHRINGCWSTPCISHWMPIPPYVAKEATP